MSIFAKIRHMFLKLRLQPIRVFCFHEIGDFCEGSSDWMSTAKLKEKLLNLKNEGYRFISLNDAYEHIINDIFRCRKYAVLTADDGLKCQMEILSWLQEQQIPITLFLNVTSLEQTECGEPYKKWFQLDTEEKDRKMAETIYLDERDIEHLDSNCVSIGLHGYAHNEPVTEMSIEQFAGEVEKCVAKFDRFKSYVPFYAYTYGKRNRQADKVLLDSMLIPVRIDGYGNYNDSTMIHRENIQLI